jgi:ribosomal protein L7Ae-like RNA K-turn-binding protein
MKTEKIQGLLGLARKAGSVLIGSRETRDGLRRRTVRLVLVASDGSPRDRQRLERVARESRTPLVVVGTREELGQGVGRGPIAVVGLTNANLAAAVRARLDSPAAAPEAARTRRQNGGQER